MKSEDIITLNIPGGVAEGMQLSVSGKGNAAARGGINGDLIIVVEEIEHEHLVRDEDNLLYEHFITIPEGTFISAVSPFFFPSKPLPIGESTEIFPSLKLASFSATSV